MEAELYNLCKYETDQHKFNLLYRGSRDGFRASDFHSKCDYKSNTITIIETTSGFIFGGYTKLNWNSNSQHYCDPDAFLFSLVNKFKKPFLCRSQSGYICCNWSYGPIFGSGYYSGRCDILISDSNSTNNYAKITTGGYQSPSGLKDPNNYYFCEDETFQVKDI